MSIEQWRDVADYGGIYQVSSRGRIKNIKSGKTLKQSENNNGYLRVGLKDKTCYVHRLVALAFIDNPDNKPTVNHIDRDKSNNQLVNLEWATYQEQSIHSGCGYAGYKEVFQLDETGNTIQEFKSINDAAKHAGVSPSRISDSVTNNVFAAGFKWKLKYSTLTEDGILRVAIPFFPGYEITQDGRVYSKKTNRYMKTRVSKRGYSHVSLRKDDKGLRMFVHRLVAMTYLPEPDTGKNVVNHLDSDPRNNHVSNLEWTTMSGNTIHAVKFGNAVTVPVCKFTMKYEFVKYYSSVAEARIDHSDHISGTCQGKHQYCGGFIWKYASDCVKIGEIYEFNGEKQTYFKNGASRRICRFSKPAWVFIQIYDTLSKASEDIGASVGQLTDVCRGNRKSAKGFFWKYADDCFECPDKTWIIPTSLKFID